MVGWVFGSLDAFSLSLAGLAAAILKASGGVCATYAQARLAGQVGNELRLEVLDGWLACHRLRQPRQSDHGQDHGQEAEPAAGAQARGVAALTSRVREVEAGLQLGVLGGARALAQLMPLLVVLVWLSPRLAWAAALVCAPFAIALGTARKRWKRANARAVRQSDALLEAADEAVRHADLWRTYGAETKVRTHLESLGRTIVHHGARLEASAAALSGGNEVLGALALVFALTADRAGWLGAESGTLLLPFAVTFFLAYRPLRDLTDARLALGRAGVALGALDGTLRGLPSGDATASPKLVGERSGWALRSLDVLALRVGRGGTAPLSFSVKAGEIVAISGPTGAGKTTLVRTLLGLEPAIAGEIRYDGVTLDGLPPGPGARPFAWVPQDAPLLADTLEANVRLGANDADARALLASLGAEHLVEALKDERLGAGGRAVSGGERQWIALARAVATGLPVLLLDEPTSGLDPVSQARVLSAISRLRGKRTVVIVTHRPEPIAIADAVVRVES